MPQNRICRLCKETFPPHDGKPTRIPARAKIIRVPWHASGLYKAFVSGWWTTKPARTPTAVWHIASHVDAQKQRENCNSP
jgi:hypothetical protein